MEAIIFRHPALWLNLSVPFGSRDTQDPPAPCWSGLSWMVGEVIAVTTRPARSPYLVGVEVVGAADHHGVVATVNVVGALRPVSEARVWLACTVQIPLARVDGGDTDQVPSEATEAVRVMVGVTVV